MDLFRCRQLESRAKSVAIITKIVHLDYFLTVWGFLRLIHCDEPLFFDVSSTL